MVFIIPVNRILIMAASQTLRNNQRTVEDVIHRVYRKMDGIRRIIRIIIIL